MDNARGPMLENAHRTRPTPAPVPHPETARPPSGALRRDFERDGFAVLRGFWSPEAVAAARRRSAELLAAVDAEAARGVFSTLDHRHSATEWFLGSAHTVRAFLEEEAVDALGRLTVPAERAVNKFGHALHRLDPVFASLSHGPALQAVAEALGLAQPQLRQSMLIIKQPGIGGEVRWHQDATYFHTAPIGVVTFWFAIEDADTDNGCLWVEPGGHRGPLRERFLLGAGADGGPGHRRLDDTPWPSLDRSVPVPAVAGDLVLMHGLLPHRSDANRSPRSRLAYTLHATDARHAWAPDNWLQPRAGDDPPEAFDPSAAGGSRTTPPTLAGGPTP